MTEPCHAGGSRRPIALSLVFLCALSACHTAPVADRTPPKAEPAVSAGGKPPPPPPLSPGEKPPDQAAEVPLQTPGVPPGLPPEARPPKSRAKPRPHAPPSP